MGFLIALGIILLILCLRVGVRMCISTAGEEGFLLYALIGPVRLKIVPSKTKYLKLRDWTPEAIAARAEEKKKAAKAKAEKKAAKKRAAADKKRLSNTELQTGAKEKTDIVRLIRKGTRAAGALFSRFGRHLRVKVKNVSVTVATGDPAETAMLYGTVCGAVEGLYQVLSQTKHFRLARNAAFHVGVDFLAEKTAAELDFTISFRIWHFFDMLIRAAAAFLRKNE